MVKNNKSPGACVAMPWYECAPGVYEIDEFDCVSCFLVVGTQRALLIDTGTGIGDLRWAVEEKLNGMPYEVVATHNHVDHIGGAAWFDEVWIHPADGNWRLSSAPATLEDRRDYAAVIRKREGKEYPYDPIADIRPWPREPVFRALSDGQRFDLGGRTVTAYHCPGHTAGELVLADDKTKALLCGDACNCLWLLSPDLAPTTWDCAEKALWALQRIMGLAGEAYDPKLVFNFHHDYRPAGKPLSPDVMPNLVSCLEAMLEGTARYEAVPDPLSSTGAERIIARCGNVMVSGMQGDIREEMARTED